MNKKIQEYASIALDDSQYKYIEKQLNVGALNNVRLFLEDCSDNLEILIALTDEKEQTVLNKQLEYLQLLEYEVLDLYYEKHE